MTEARYHGHRFLGFRFLDYDLVPISAFFIYCDYSPSVGLPAKGMQAIPNALADQLPSERILLNSSVHALTTIASGVYR